MTDYRVASEVASVKDQLIALKRVEEKKVAALERIAVACERHWGISTPGNDSDVFFHP